MKRIIFKSAVIMIAALLSLTSCQKQIQPSAADNSSVQAMSNNSSNGVMEAPLKVDLQHVYVHIEDADGNMPEGDATPLYNKNGGQHVPIMTPDGEHQVTLGEYNMMSGWADVKCVNAGTHVVMHLKGLIPNGVYTIWTLTYQYPGFNGVSIPVNRIGFGALGAIEGSANSNAFTANEEGNASISVMRPEGKLLTDGSVNPHPDYVVPNCLGDVFETHLALAYHLNNTAAAPGPPPTWVVQGFFQIWGSQL
jgi:hypothetical protein